MKNEGIKRNMSKSSWILELHRRKQDFHHHMERESWDNEENQRLRLESALLEGQRHSEACNNIDLKKSKASNEWMIETEMCQS